MPGIVEDTNGAAPAKARKPTKNELRRAKKKQVKRTTSETPSRAISPNITIAETPTSESKAPSEIQENDQAATLPADPMQTDESMLDQFDLSPNDPLFEQFKDTFAKFELGGRPDVAQQEPDKGEVFYDDENDEIPDEEEEAEAIKTVSKKQRKKMNKLTVAELKGLVRKPELVEWTDTDAHDPKLLVTIKSQRNVVPVPVHWQLKREYLSSKRGIEKAGFALPKFIADTGISEMRDAVLEKQNEASLKQRQRERVQPKMGKLDIDYQKLYEAFFRHQTKPELTRYGEVYYEGKEHETNLRHLRPGELSDELREALGMPPGAPPPWLINQQRFGPSPSYPALKVPGLNAPPPPGASWGFHPGGYGKPPVDDVTQQPLFGGDIFDMRPVESQAPAGVPVEKTLWGELQPPEEESEAEEEEDEEDEEGEGQDQDMGGLETPGGLATPSGMASSAPSQIGGMESVGGDFTLRKEKRGTETEESTAPRSAYQVLPEQNIRAQGFFGGDRAYDMRATQNNIPVLGQETSGRKRKVGDVDVSVDVEALERDDRLSKEEVQRQFEASRSAQANGQWKGSVDQEDLSNMIAEESRKRLKQDQERSEARRQGRR